MSLSCDIVARILPERWETVNGSASLNRSKRKLSTTVLLLSCELPVLPLLHNLLLTQNKRMKALTFSWDYPPARNGGLGVACFGLTRELARSGVEVILVLPKTQRVLPGHARFVFADTERMLRLIEVPGISAPYKQSNETLTLYDHFGRKLQYGRTILQEVHRFAHLAAQIAREEQHDIIHAHDWTSYLAGVAAKFATGRPLILHVHATSFDQAAGNNVDPAIYAIEYEAFHAADSIVAVSDFTRNIIVTKHGVPADKVTVIHNGCDIYEPTKHQPTLAELKAQGKRIVMYHGRITIQKGVDYFVRAARRVIDYDHNVVFVVSGWGDMQTQIIELVGQLGLSKHFIFAGSLWDEERDRMYQTADLVVMPSVSEPFGLVPLEALQNGTASLISKQSGVGEVMKHVLKVDFWDIDDMANKIIAALKYPVMNNQLVREGRTQLPLLHWSVAARKITELYRRLVQLVTT